MVLCVVFISVMILCGVSLMIWVVDLVLGSIIVV